MSQSAEPNSQADANRLEEAADEAIAVCGGDARHAVKALIVANGYLETEVQELRAAVSIGYARGKFELVPRDRKDWYD
jgi:stage V sporulation protein SpoVS